MASALQQSRGRLAGAWCLALLAVIGFDLLLHGGAFVRLYAVRTPFLLEPSIAFRRIPLGYASFGILVLLVEWLMVRLTLVGFRRGAAFGLELGGLVWGSLAIGLWSIATARPALLLSWGIGQTIELGVAGAVLGAALASAGFRGLVWRVLAFFAACVAGGILLQNLLA